MNSNSTRNEQYIDSDGSQEHAVKAGVQWLGQLDSENSSKQDALLATPVKRNLEGTVESVIGEDRVKELKNKNSISAGEVQIHHITERIDAPAWNGGPVLAIYPTKDLLDKIDDMRGVTDVLVIPWNRDEVQFWIDQWRATDLSSGEPEQSEKNTLEIVDPIVEEALLSLHTLVNVSTGLTHPSDRSQAIEMFKILDRNGHQYDPDTLRMWLVAEKGWSPENADEVREVAEGVLNGKSFQYESNRWADDILEQWRDRAETDQ
jgi:hypothetical protein